MLFHWEDLVAAAKEHGVLLSSGYTPIVGVNLKPGRRKQKLFIFKTSLHKDKAQMTVVKPPVSRNGLDVASETLSSC